MGGSFHAQQVVMPQSGFQFAAMPQMMPQQCVGGWWLMTNAGPAMPCIAVQAALPQQQTSQTQGQTQVSTGVTDSPTRKRGRRGRAAREQRDSRDSNGSETTNEQVILPKPVKAMPPPAKGDAPRTTVMLRNMPNNYSRKMFIEMLDHEGFTGHMDFLYLPMDFERRASLGYAFVN